LAGALTSSLPSITPAHTCSAYLILLSISGPVPSPRISKDSKAGVFDSDLNLLSSNIPSITPIAFKKFNQVLFLNMVHQENGHIYIPVAMAEAELIIDSAESPSVEASETAILRA